MKKILTLLLTAILALLCFTSCSQKEVPSVKYSKDGDVVKIAGRSYVRVDPGPYTYFFPETYNIYSKKEKAFSTGVFCQVTSSLSQDIVAFGDVASAEEHPVETAMIYASSRLVESVEDFASERYSSFTLISRDFTEGYDFSSSLLSETSFSGEAKLGLYEMNVNVSKHWIVYGYDSTGSLARPIGVVLKKDSKYYYVDHKELNYEQMFFFGDVAGQDRKKTNAHVFSKDSRAALRQIFDEGPDRAKATRQLRPSLYEALKEDFAMSSGAVAVLVISVILIVLAALLLLWYLYLYRLSPKMALSLRTYVVLLGRLWHKFLSLFRKERKTDVSKEEFKGMNITLTKEDLTWQPEDLPEDNVEALNRSFCPVCGVKCDWTRPTCGACGAPLILGDRYKGMVKFEQDRTVHSPDGHVVDLSTVTRSVYLHHYAPKKLKKALNRHAFWFYAIAAEYLLTFFIVFVELLTLLQSFWGAAWFLIGAIAYLACAVSYHRNKGLVSTVILSAGTLLWSILCFCSIETLVGIYSVPYIVLSCITYTLPIIAAGVALYRVIQLEQGYRDFLAGRIYQ